MEQQQEPLPDRMKALPQYKGFPIPFTTFMKKEPGIPVDVPDFKITDMDKWARCVAGSLCAICGQTLSYWIWFIGGPACRDNRLFFDLGMHEECARFAAATCPYLAYGHDHQKNPVLPEGTHVDEQASNIRPAELFLFRTRGYVLVKVGTAYYVKAEPFKEVVLIETRVRQKEGDGV